MTFPRAWHADASGGKWPWSEFPNGLDAGRSRARDLHKALDKEVSPQKTMRIYDRFCSHEPGNGRWREDKERDGGARRARGDRSRPPIPCGREKVHFRTKDPPVPLLIRNSHRLVVGEASWWEPCASCLTVAQGRNLQLSPPHLVGLPDQPWELGGLVRKHSCSRARCWSRGPWQQPHPLAVTKHLRASVSASIKWVLIYKMEP